MPDVIPNVPQNFVAWLGVIGAIIGAFWAIVTFRRNNRIKAAEILIGIEKEYERHIDTLLKVEHMADYDKFFRSALKKSIKPGVAEYSKFESGMINRLEAALRHFYVCSCVRRLSVDSGSIDRLCSW